MIMENDEPLQSNEYLYKSNCNNDIENNIEEIEIPEFTIEHIQKIDDNYRESLSQFKDFNIHIYEQNYNKSANELYELLTVHELYNEHLDNVELLQFKMNDYNSIEIYELNNSQINTETHIKEYLNKRKYIREMYLEEILPIINNDAENLEKANNILEKLQGCK
jgi:hypothetical protein